MAVAVRVLGVLGLLELAATLWRPLGARLLAAGAIGRAASLAADNLDLAVDTRRIAILVVVTLDYFHRFLHLALSLGCRRLLFGRRSGDLLFVRDILAVRARRGLGAHELFLA